MKKKIIGNIIIAVCVIGIFSIVFESGYSIGNQRTTECYEHYQSERDALIKNIMTNTNDSYDKIIQKVDGFLGVSYDKNIDFSKVHVN